jgi:hypothetical protein
MMRRRRFDQSTPLHERLDMWAQDMRDAQDLRDQDMRDQDLRDQAAKLPPGPEREALIKKARQADTASHLDEWANSPGLQPPT